MMSRALTRALAVMVLTGLCAATLLAGGCSSATPTEAAEDPVQAPSTEGEAAEAAEWVVTLLDGYPEDAVPLYEMTEIDTVFFSVRDDPAYVLEGLRNYHQVVYSSSASPDAVLDYYRGLLDAVDQDRSTDEQVAGTIGSYDIVARASDWNDETIVYLTVDLPDSELSEENPFFADYPADLVEIPEAFVFFEEMFYRVLLEDNDMSYTRHFFIADANGDGVVDLDEDARYTFFEERYGDREGFSADREAGQITWVDGEYNVTVAYGGGENRGVVILGFDAE